MLSKFSSTTIINLFFPRTTVLLGGSLVKKLTELYNLRKYYAVVFAGIVIN